MLVPRPWRDYLVGILATGVVAALRLFLNKYLGNDAPFLLFTSAVMVAAWHGGFWPGLFTTLLSLFVGFYLFVEPEYSFAVTSLNHVIRILLFLVVGISISALSERLHRQQRHTLRALHSAEERRIQLEREILDRERAESSMRDSDRRYQLLLEGVPQLVWTCLSDGRCDFLSRQWIEYTGIPEEQQLGYGWLEAVHPDDRESLMESWQRSVRERCPFDVEFRIRAAAGNYRWFKTRAVLLNEEDGSNKWFGTNTDIEDKKQIEHELREVNATLEQRVAERTAVAETERRFLDAVLEALPIAVVIANSEGKLLRFNNAFTQFWRTKNCSASDPWHHEWVGYWPTTNRRLEPREWPLARALHHGESCSGKLIRIERFEETRKRFVLKSAAPIKSSNGEIVAAVTASIDVTEQMETEAAVRASEERFRLVVEATGMGIWDTPFPLTGYGWDDRLKTIWGFSPDTSVEETLVFQRVHPADRSHVEMQIREALNPTGEGMLKMEHRILLPDDSVRWLSVWGRTLFGGSEENRVATRSIGVMLDVTERREAEERIRNSLLEKEVLLKEIHHRVKNNLQIVSSLLDLQSDHVSDAQAAMMFQESRGRVKSMALIHERLYRSHDLARVNFADYVRQLVEDLCHSYRITEESVQIEVDVISSPLPIDVAIPCGLLLNELITNCFKHAFPVFSQSWVKVTLHENPGEVTLSVADNGVGIPPGVDVLSPSSFGLQLVNTLVAQLRGRLHLENEKGTAFVVCFPIRD